MQFGVAFTSAGFAEFYDPIPLLLAMGTNSIEAYTAPE
jgi:hypothetical protein